MIKLNNDKIREEVRKHYAKTSEGCCGGPAPNDADACCVADADAKAVGESGCGCGSTSSDDSNNLQGACCSNTAVSPNETSKALGYSISELESLPQGANLGLGCGNPQAIASIKEGETVLDLGSGAGIDCFLAAKATGDSGFVIGVDMTPEMISKAKSNAEKSGYKNVEFRLGEIEHLPVADNSVDVIISNCVINLSPEKRQVYAETFRVLKPGGRIAVSDIVLTAVLPEELQNDMFLYTGCMAGASSLPDIESFLVEAGFSDIRISPKNESREFIREWVPNSKIENYVVSASIQAIKPN
ncbi:MAG: arsenite S-adenosylmethyltransferase [Ignavibacteriae bacterium HGW-Ignavibacteriae-1]|jgi:SAM-dependent methyltransferase|nr:MAG: arsenite S-adenosylmethyltransferase [Ignavibacteriae bacterium HGW-Ignavibacteriae-1]